MERGQYDSANKACVDINGLHEMIHIILVDLVANKYNRGVGGIPDDLWNEGLKISKVSRGLPQNREYIELLFASESKYRVLGLKGIEIFGQFFYSEAVNELRLRIRNESGNPKVRVRHGIDLRHIYVYDEFEKRYLEASLKQTSRLIRCRIDPRYPLHVEHLSELCNKNNREDYTFLQNQENVSHALKVLEEVVREGKKEYSLIKRRRRKVEDRETSLVSAVNELKNKASLVPENPNIILIKSEATDLTPGDKHVDLEVSIPEKAVEPSEISKIITTENVDLQKINSSWGIGRKS
ncbi:hypothetical protein [Paenibacillus sp. 276b]|uniref:hypothetical protein n=2 Tax=unclassified Paenibacillus TaxID=185978 RepID=UPI0013747491|nr:hypothetical protein [Paenibacillus sp. 276b]